MEHAEVKGVMERLIQENRGGVKQTDDNRNRIPRGS